MHSNALMHIPNHWEAFCWYPGIPNANRCRLKRDGLSPGVWAANGILTLFIPRLAVNTRGEFLSQRTSLIILITLKTPTLASLRMNILGTLVAGLTIAFHVDILCIFLGRGSEWGVGE